MISQNEVYIDDELDERKPKGKTTSITKNKTTTKYTKVEDDKPMAKPSTETTGDNYTPSNAYWDFINSSLEQYKPQPNDVDAGRHQRLAKVHAIAEGLRVLSEGIGLKYDVPVEKRGPNQDVLKSLQDFNRVKATDSAKADAHNRLAMDLKLKAMLQDDQNKASIAKQRKEDDRYNKERTFEEEKWKADKDTKDNKAKADANADALNRGLKKKELDLKEKELANKGNTEQDKNTLAAVDSNGQVDKLDQLLQTLVLNKITNDPTYDDDMDALMFRYDDNGQRYITQRGLSMIVQNWQKYKDDIIGSIDDPKYKAMLSKSKGSSLKTKEGPLFNPFVPAGEKKPEGYGVLKPENIQETKQGAEREFSDDELAKLFPAGVHQLDSTSKKNLLYQRWAEIDSLEGFSEEKKKAMKKEVKAYLFN